MTYGTTITVPAAFDDAVERTRAALKEQGFGVLTEIDVRATFHEKLGAESSQALGDYVILGACNPPLAQQVLTAEPDMGLLLPCNVVIRRAPGAAVTTVQAIDPQTMVELSSSGAIKGTADEVGRRLRAVLTSVESGFAS
ncbi:MAG: DUF302 domain-containing protein [Microbacteriaceae bacterium]